MPKRVVWWLVAVVVAVLVSVLVAVLALGLVGVGVLPRPGGDRDATPAAAPVTTLDALAATDPLVARAAFCDDLSAARVGAALGGRAEDAEAYDNGDTVALGTGAAGTTDVAHEYGCSWTGADETVVRAWVFAPPVTAARARRLARLAEGGAGCAPDTPGAGFGDPTTAYTCGDGDQVVAGRAGLFGDAWLSCTVTGPGGAPEAASLRDRADRWCVDVAIAAA